MRLTAPTDYFAGRIAQAYDADVAWNSAPETIAPAVKRLKDLAQGGPFLEFAIGTGRVALPLQAAGAEVEGIEFSADMIAMLKKKPGSATIRVVQGDMATADMGRSYALVFLVFNTIMNLTTQAAQVQCFKNASRHLNKGGRFVVETMLPDLRRYPPGAVAVPFDVSKNHIGFDTYEIVEQKLTSHHVNITADGSAQANSLPFRYVWPSELDLMAELAGMRLIARHEDWIGTPFTDNSRNHISVWEKL